MRKLFVGGCSFSDYTKVERVYGEILAELLGYEYIHVAKGCGSNYKMWRKLTKYLMDGILTSNDLLIVQYTEVTRDEIWCPNILPDRLIGLVDEVDGGYITDWKLGSYKWQEYPEVSEFHQTKENFYTSEVFDVEKFYYHHFMFQSMLAYYKIPTIFVEGIRIGSWGDKVKPILLPEFEKMFFPDAHFIRPGKFSEYDLEPGIDVTHLNQQGHYVYADKLVEHIKHIGI